MVRGAASPFLLVGNGRASTLAICRWLLRAGRWFREKGWFDYPVTIRAAIDEAPAAAAHVHID